MGRDASQPVPTNRASHSLVPSGTYRGQGPVVKRSWELKGGQGTMRGGPRRSVCCALVLEGASPGAPDVGR
jgi:hypothetical protein